VIRCAGRGSSGSIAPASPGLLSLAQLVDLIVLLPVGWLADRIGRLPVLTGVAVTLGCGLFAVGLGSLPLLVVGCASSVSAWRAGCCHSGSFASTPTSPGSAGGRVSTASGGRSDLPRPADLRRAGPDPHPHLIALVGGRLRDRGEGGRGKLALALSL
jgi:MFS family permease